MAEYIEKAALMRHIEEQAHEWGEDYDAQQILGDIEDFPVESTCPYYVHNEHDRGNDSLCRKAGCEVEAVRRVVRSEWIKNDNGTWYCKRCQSWIPDEQRYYANWCLFCGADMRGDEDDKRKNS